MLEAIGFGTYIFYGAWNLIAFFLGKLLCETQSSCDVNFC